MIEEIKNIYGWLEDDVSKEIYLNRLNFLITGNVEYMTDVARKYCSDIMVDFKALTLLNDIESSGLSKDIIVYGAGKRGTHFIWDRDQWKGLRIKYVCDADERKQKTGVFGYKVVSPEIMLKNYMGETIVVLLERYRDKEYVRNVLSQDAVPSDRIIDGTRYGRRSSDRQYFYETFLNFDKEEVFVDAGVLDLSSTTEFKKLCPGLKKSYAFEHDSKSFARCCEKIKRESLDYIELFPYGLWSSRKTMSFDAKGNKRSNISDEGTSEIQVVPMDELITESVTFIKMDIEGAELEALKGAKKTIQDNKPKLAICIYHKYEDMWEIPMYIKELVPEYKLYVRHYSSHGPETVLFAV